MIQSPAQKKKGFDSMDLRETVMYLQMDISFFSQAENRISSFFFSYLLYSNCAGKDDANILTSA